MRVRNLEPLECWHLFGARPERWRVEKFLPQRGTEKAPSFAGVNNSDKLQRHAEDSQRAANVAPAQRGALSYFCCTKGPFVKTWRGGLIDDSGRERTRPVWSSPRISPLAPRRFKIQSAPLQSHDASVAYRGWKGILVGHRRIFNYKSLAGVAACGLGLGCRPGVGARKRRSRIAAIDIEPMASVPVIVRIVFVVSVPLDHAQGGADCAG